ncbi:MAG: acyl-CoA thioesterase [Pseudonocardiales bacterium]|nr:acyl-CoA thioesterase [Pseudonocardiales bacterium]
MGRVLWWGVLAGVGYGLWRRRLGRLRRMPDDFSAYWLRRARRTGELRYVALGDSLAQGLSARRPELGFVGLLADGLADSTGSSVGVLNLSVTGATVTDVLATQLPRLSALPGPPPDLVTVCVGSNDVTGGDPDRFRSEFRELCARLPAGTLVADVPDFKRGPHQATAAGYARLCRDVLAGFPALRPVRLERATRSMRVFERGADLAHPGNAGHRRFASAFAAALGMRRGGHPTREWRAGS